jgi:hypothetical protein
MAKAIVHLGYHEYVLDLQDAAKVLDILSTAEVHRTKYHTGEGGRTGFTSYHIFSQEDGDGRTNLTVLSDDAYRKAKLLGKPDE